MSGDKGERDYSDVAYFIRLLGHYDAKGSRL